MSLERQEKTSEIVVITKHKFQEVFSVLYKHVRAENKSNRYILRDFQNALQGISEWDHDKKKQIADHFGATQSVIHNLLTDIAYMQSISTLVPKTVDFIYQCILNIARELWTKPFLYYHRVNKQDYQKNMILVEKLIMNEIKTTVRRIDKIAVGVRKVGTVGTVSAISAISPLEVVKTIDIVPVVNELSGNPCNPCNPVVQIIEHIVSDENGVKHTHIDQVRVVQGTANTGEQTVTNVHVLAPTHTLASDKVKALEIVAPESVSMISSDSDSDSSSDSDSDSSSDSDSDSDSSNESSVDIPRESRKSHSVSSQKSRKSRKSHKSLGSRGSRKSSRSSSPSSASSASSTTSATSSFSDRTLLKKSVSSKKKNSKGSKDKRFKKDSMSVYANYLDPSFYTPTIKNAKKPKSSFR
jgi:hypothetical protein